MIKVSYTWNEFLDFLLMDKKVKNSPKNITVYHSRFKKLQAYFINTEFNRKNFNLFLSEMKRSGSSPAYMNCLIKLAKNYGRFVNMDELKDYTYFEEEQEDVEVLSLDEVKKIATYKYPYQRMEEYRNLRDYVAIMFLYDTASRIQDLENVLWSNVFATPIPFVVFKKFDTKSSKKTTLPITKDLYNLLQQLPKNGNRVFDSITGKRFSRTQFSKCLKERAVACGITINVYPHLFRHTKLTHLGTIYKFPLAEITKIARHADPKQTMRYMHPDLLELLPLVYASPFISREDSLKQVPNLIIDYMKKLYGIACSIEFSQISQDSFNYQVKLTNALE
jgi:integrase